MQKIGFCDKYSLTQAVLDGAKSMTRRLEKELDRLISEYQMRYDEPIRIVEQKWDKDKNCLLLYAHTGIADTDREHVLTLKPRYKLGEVVAVAQSYEAIRNERYKDYCNDIYNPFGAKEPDLESEPGWTNKLFVRPDLMPHQIKITGVRIERLQAISNEDCLKEGVFDSNVGYNRFGFRDKHCDHNWYYPTPRAAFAALIDRPRVGRKGLWQSNPFVVVYQFKLVK